MAEVKGTGYGYTFICKKCKKIKHLVGSGYTGPKGKRIKSCADCVKLEKEAQIENTVC